MRSLVFLLIISLTLWLGSSTPINPKRWLINRPQEPAYRAKRTPQYLYVKGLYPVKGHSPSTERPEPSLAKGEYLCGNRVCRLQPGEVPKGCNGVCQYRV